MRPTVVDSGAAALARCSTASARAAGRSRSCCSTRTCRTWTASRSRAGSRDDAELAGATIMMLSSSGQYGETRALPRARHRRVPDQAGRSARPARARSAARSRASTGQRAPLPGVDAAGRPAGAAAARAARRRQRRQPAARGGLLERRGHDVTIAGNGREALAALERAAVRRRADGRADAGDGRLRGDRRDPRARARRPARTCRSSR